MVERQRALSYCIKVPRLGGVFSIGSRIFANGGCGKRAVNGGNGKMGMEFLVSGASRNSGNGLSGFRT